MLPGRHAVIVASRGNGDRRRATSFLIITANTRPGVPPFGNTRLSNICALHDVSSTGSVGTTDSGGRIIVINANFVKVRITSTLTSTNAATSVAVINHDHHIVDGVISRAIDGTLVGLRRRGKIAFTFNTNISGVAKRNDGIDNMGLSSNDALTTRIIVLNANITPHARLLGRMGTPSNIRISRRLRLHSNICTLNSVTGTAGRVKHVHVRR